MASTRSGPEGMIRESVVIVDGEPAPARRARDGLGHQGQLPNVELASSAGEAVEVAARLQPGLVVFFHVAFAELARADVLRRVHAVSPASRVMVFPRSPGSPRFDDTVRDIRTARNGGRRSVPASGAAEALMPAAVVGATRTRTLPARRQSAAEARRTVSEACAEAGEGPLVEDGHRVASELVSNAVLHAGTVIDLTVRAGGGAVQIDVGDGTSDRPIVRAAAVGDLGGRGLMLVDSLCSLWGIDPAPSGKTIWARLSPPSTAAAGDRLVEVQNQFDGRWLEGFRITGADGDRYWLTRADGSRVPTWVPGGRVRPADPGRTNGHLPGGTDDPYGGHPAGRG